MITDIWEDFLDIVRQEAGSRVVETWFKAVQLKNWDHDQKIAYLHAPNAFVRNWLIAKYTTLIELNLARLLHASGLKIHIIVADKEEEGVLQVKPTYLPVAAKTKLAPVPSKGNGYLNKDYLFENFVVGPSNSLAYAAAQAVAEKPGSVYNPLFVYGGSGLGKTHLLHAIGNAVKQQNSYAEVLYQTADRFVNEFINAIRFDKVHKFKSKYENVDVLLIDDSQFIANKEQTQEAFFHIFNTLHEARKQIVFSSDMIPQNMKGIAERLRSRMAWGLVTDIHIPKLETKIAILKKKAHANNEFLSDEVAHFIADTVDSNIRELEGALIRVIAFAALTKQPVSVQLAQKVLSCKAIDGKKRIDSQTILQSVSRHYGCTIHELQSKNRNKNIVHARHVAIFLMKKFTNKSLRDIGLFLGGRDHSTVMHAYTKIEDELMHNEDFAKKIRIIEKDLSC